MKIHEEIWTTGITVKEEGGRWIAECKWNSGEFANSGYMQGVLYTKYYEETMAEAVDYVLGYMKRMGIRQIDEVNASMKFALYHDEENEESLSDDVKWQIKEEAARRGWECYIDD